MPKNVPARVATTAEEGSLPAQLPAAELLGAVLGTCSDGIVVFDATGGTVVEFNDQAAIRLAYSRDEFARLTAADLLVGLDAEPPLVLLTAATVAGPQGLAIKQRARDGTLQDACLRASLVAHRGESFIVVTIRDSTESQQREGDHERRRLARRERVRERLNDALVRAPALERSLELALDVVIEELCCERVSLTRMPQDDATQLEFMYIVQRTRSGRPGPIERGVRVPVNAEIRKVFDDILKAKDLVDYDLRRVAETLPAAFREEFPITSGLLAAVRPRIGRPWMLSLVEESPREWVDDDKDIVREIVPRFEDVLTAKLMQEELQHTQRSLDTAQSRARIGNWEMDVANQCSLWSAEMFVLYYRDRAQGTPTPAEALELVHPDDRSYVETAIGAFIASGDERCIIESRTSPTLGPVRILRNVVDREMRGEHLFLVGTAKDVTEQRQAKHLAERLDDLLKQFDVGVFSYTTAGDLLEMNDALVRLLDCSSASEAIQQGYQQVLFGRSPLPVAGPPVDPGREREVRVTTALGHERLLWVSTRPLAIAGKIYRIDGLVRDVTAERLSERRGRASAVAAAKVDMLTSREREVLDRVVVGEANKVIARGLGLSEKTVEKHRASLMRKTGAKSVAELVRLALLAQKVSGE